MAGSDSKHFATTLERSINTFFSTSKCNGYRRERCSAVLQSFSLKLPCSFVNMGQWNLLHYLITIDSISKLKVFYLADIFSLMNELSYFLQAKSKSQIEAAEKVSNFKTKLSLWKKRVRNQNFAMFYCWTVKLVIRKLTNG